MENNLLINIMGLKNKKILDIRCQSFFYKENLKNEFNLIYFLMDDNFWYFISVSDGEVSIKKHTRAEFDNEVSAEGDGEFVYKVITLYSVVKFINKEILSIKKYLYNGILDECLGIIIIFKDLTLLNILDIEDAMIIEDRINTDVLIKSNLVEL